MTPGALSRDDLLSLLSELAAELDRRGARATLFVVGGAAMSLAFDARRSTNDVDGAFEPSPQVRKAAAEVARRHALDEDWLNDAAKGFMPGTDPGATLALDSPALRVELASAEYLLAMKVQAARVEQDFDDIRTLYRVLGLTTAEQGMEIAERYYGGAGMAHLLRPGSRYLLGEVAEDLRRSPEQAPPGAPLEQPALSTRCGRCGRPLRSLASMKRGFGPGCARRA